jgi:predicted membrane protein
MKEKIQISSNRSFGIVFFIVFLLIGLYPLIDGGSLSVWALIISSIFLFLGILNSRALTSLNIIWFKFGIFLSKFFGPLIMGIIFFLIVTPIGLIMRFFKKDLLNLKFNKDKSYWIKKTGPKSKMKNQF